MEFEIAFWEWPTEDETAWRKLTGETMNRREYLDLITAAQADQERQGRTVRRVRFAVAEMECRLVECGFPNDPAHRAVITAAWPDLPGK